MLLGERVKTEYRESQSQRVNIRFNRSYRNEIEKTNKDIKILHEPQNQIIDVEADKNRLTQVISFLKALWKLMEARYGLRITLTMMERKELPLHLVYL